MVSFKVFGDSHSKYFGITRELRSFLGAGKGVDIKVNSIAAASVKGFGKRSSTLNVSKKIQSDVGEDELSCFVLAFGQVDVELGYFYSKYVKKQELTFNSFAKDLVSIYFDFIDALDMDRDKLIVKGVNIPVLVHDKNKSIGYTKRIITENTTNNELVDNVVRDMKENWPSGVERTLYHLQVNEMLKQRCVQRGIKYFDINADLICKITGVVSSDFIPSGNDHHLVDSVGMRARHITSLMRSYYSLFE